VNGIGRLLDDPVVLRLGLALMHFLWQGAVVAAIAALALVALRKASAASRYVALLAVLAVMAASPVATYLVMSAAPMPVEARPSPTSAPAPIAPSTTVAVPPNGAAPGPESEVRAARPGLHGQAVLASLRNLLPWVVVLWAAGVVLLSLRLMTKWRVIGIAKNVSVEVAGDRWGLTMETLAQRLRVSRAVRLLESAAVQVPTVVGWLRPVIMLPASALPGLTPEQWQAILAHELAHIRRNDYLVNLGQTVVETLLFYHPAVWWVSGRIRAERELCCDDLAVEACDDAMVYARALAELEELRAVPEPALGAGGGSLVRRVRRLTRADEGRRSHLSARLAGAVALAVVAASGMGIGLAGQYAGTPAAPPGSGSIASSVAVELAKSPWPKFRGGAQNTGRGLGSGATGHVKWSFRTGGVVEGGPAIGPDGTVYVWSYDGYLYAIRASTGMMKWKAAVGKPSAINYMTPTPLVLSDGTVVIGSVDGYVYAIQAADGRTKWRVRTGGEEGSLAEVVSAAVGPDGILYIPSRDRESRDGGTLYALDSSTGEKRWELQLGLMQSSPAVARDGTVYIGNNHYGFCALDGRTGRIKWTLPIWAAGTPTISDTGDIYVGGYGLGPNAKDRRAYAIDGAAGTIKWSSHIVKRSESTVMSEPAIGMRGLVYFASSDGTLHALRGSDGSTEWDVTFGKGVLPTPVVSSDGTVYAGAFEDGVGKLVALDGMTGQRRWEAKVGSGLNRSAAIDSDGTIYIGSWQGDVYAIQ